MISAFRTKSSRNSPVHRLVRASFLPDGNGLGSRTASGVGFTFFGVGIRFLLSMVSTAILARLLSPREFGEVAMAMIVTELATLFGNVGLQSIIVQKRRLFRIQLDTIFWAGIGLAVLLTIGVILASFFAGAFFHDDKVGTILKLSAATFILEEARSAHQAIIYRLMLFKLDFYLQSASLVLRFGLAILLAVEGFGVYSMVIGPLLGLFLTVVATWILIPYRPRLKFSKGFLVQNVRVGANYLGGGFLFYCITNFDLIVIGRMLGAIELGYYQTARSLTDELRARIAAPLQRVLFPAYSLMQGDSERFRGAIERSTRLLALIIAPLGLGIAVTAPEMVALLYGEKWMAMVPVLGVIAIAASFRATFAISTPIFNAMNRTDASLRFNTVNTVLFFVVIVIGAYWGAVGVAYGSLASALMFSLVLAGAYRIAGLGMRKLFRALASPYIAGGVMYAAVFGCRLLLTSSDWGQLLIVRIVLLVLTGIVSYVVTLLLIDRPLVQDAIGVIRGIISRRR